jgi:hypothetical protein
MFNARQLVEKEMNGWRRSGRPSIIAEFLHRNGRAFSEVRYPRRQGRLGNCFSNAIEYAEEHGVSYVEGYGFWEGIATHHAWCSVGDVAIEPTWRPAQGGGVYFGVVLDAKQAMKRMCDTKISGLLSPHGFWDEQFMVAVDPGFPAFYAELTCAESQPL